MEKATGVLGQALMQQSLQRLVETKQQPPSAEIRCENCHEMLRTALTVFVETFEDLLLVGEAKNGAEAIRLCALLQPDVLLMSLGLPPMDGLHTTRRISQTYPHIHVIILSSSNALENMEAAILAGQVAT